jgi:hypothetical protein
MKDATILLEDLADAYNGEFMRAEQHREKAKNIDERAKAFKANNSGANPQWLDERVREMRSQFDHHVSETKISERRADLFDQGYFPAGRDETGDAEYMSKYADLYSRCAARDRLRDTGAPLRHHPGVRDAVHNS